MEFVAYGIFIVVLAIPFLVAAGILGLLLVGLLRIFSGILRARRIDILGVTMTIVGLVIGTAAYQWWRGPKAELATLQPLVVDRQLAAKLPRAWVFDYGATGAVFDLVPLGYADRVFNARILSPSLSASIPEEQREAFMEEIKLVNSSACNAFAASGARDDRMFECITRTAVSKAEIDASGPYLALKSYTIDDSRGLTYALVIEGNARPIARCVGRAPRETNPLFAMIRRDRSLEVASSIYKCSMRAASGGLSRVIATGAMG